MNRDEIVKMAREAGLVRTGDKWVEPARWGVTELVHFAALVAAAERNRTWTQAHWTEYERSIVAAEREACAKLIESRMTGASELMDTTREMEANAIRARGNT